MFDYSLEMLDLEIKKNSKKALSSYKNIHVSNEGVALNAVLLSILWLPLGPIYVIAKLIESYTSRAKRIAAYNNAPVEERLNAIDKSLNDISNNGNNLLQKVPQNDSKPDKDKAQKIILSMKGEFAELDNTFDKLRADCKGDKALLAKVNATQSRTKAKFTSVINNAKSSSKTR